MHRGSSGALVVPFRACFSALVTQKVVAFLEKRAGWGAGQRGWPGYVRCPQWVWESDVGLGSVVRGRVLGHGALRRGALPTLRDQAGTLRAS